MRPFAPSACPGWARPSSARGVALSPGGKGSNQAVAAARLGAEVRFISKIGRDAFADMGLAAWAEAGVEPLVARSDSAATGAAAVLVDAATGENAIVVCPGAASEISEADVDAAAEAIRSAAVFVTQFEQPLPAAARALAIAREAGVATILNPGPSGGGAWGYASGSAIMSRPTKPRLRR